MRCVRVRSSQRFPIIPSSVGQEVTEVPVEFPEGDIPLTGGAKGKAQDVADAVLFLASDASRHITGTPIWIDGGQSLLR